MTKTTVQMQRQTSEENVEEKNIAEENAEKKTVTEEPAEDKTVTEENGADAVHVSVRSFVEFLLRSGNIDERIPGASEEAMREGARVHRALQKAEGADYEAEVSLKLFCAFKNEEIAGDTDEAEDGAEEKSEEKTEEKTGEMSGRIETDPADAKVNGIVIEGRADGIYYGRIPKKERPAEMEGELWTIDEIKTTYRKVQDIEQAEEVHLAQAKCYAYIWANDNELERVRVRMTYCVLPAETVRHFYYEYSFDALKEWFENLVEEYRKWAEFSAKWRRQRNRSADRIEVPFAWRAGQRELAVHVYHTIAHERKLFIEAPTGAGKTLAVMFPAVKEIGREKAERIFYLTAKNITGGVPEETTQLLREQGLRCKSVTLTAKEKSCACETVACRPDKCPRARGHFDRINDAMYALLTQEDRFDRVTVARYAEEYCVCPFELSLDMALFSDIVICDYNYVFDPHVYLRRFFGEGVKKAASIFLIDEAHNLLERGREMYSAQISRRKLKELRKKIRDLHPGLWKSLGKCMKTMRAIEKETEGEFSRLTDIDIFAGNVYEVYGSIRRILDEKRKKQIKSGNVPREAEIDSEKELLECYFAVSHFLLIYEKTDEHYVIYSDPGKEDHILRLYCVDPASHLAEKMENAVSSILFSATLLPIQYYKQLLGGTEKDYEVYAGSSFDPNKRGVFVFGNVTSRYKERGPVQYRKIAEKIREISRCRAGNYLVFFPSYAFLNEVRTAFEEICPGTEGIEILVQTDSMSIEDREEFLARFSGREPAAGAEEGKSLLGFCVLGGAFSEGVDLREDRLIGVMIVGTGLPQVCKEREILKTYFEEQGKNGFDYAYRYPGMNRVLQAAGRVHRTEKDEGIIALLDRRFADSDYRKLFPKEWTRVEFIGGNGNVDNSSGKNETERKIGRFWAEEK